MVLRLVSTLTTPGAMAALSNGAIAAHPPKTPKNSTMTPSPAATGAVKPMRGAVAAVTGGGAAGVRWAVTARSSFDRHVVESALHGLPGQLGEHLVARSNGLHGAGPEHQYLIGGLQDARAMGDHDDAHTFAA